MKTTTDELAIPRRTLLVVAGASGVLVACGGDEPSESGQSATPDSPPSSSQDASAPSSAGEPIAAVAEVAVAGGVINKDLHIVVTQPMAGDYRAFSSICTHKGCDVGSVADNVITCTCHGSQFSAETGDVSHGPATQPLAQVPVVVEGDTIVRA